MNKILSTLLVLILVSCQTSNKEDEIMKVLKMDLQIKERYADHLHEIIHNKIIQREYDKYFTKFQLIDSLVFEGYKSIEFGKVNFKSIQILDSARSNTIRLEPRYPFKRGKSPDHVLCSDSFKYVVFKNQYLSCLIEIIEIVTDYLPYGSDAMVSDIFILPDRQKYIAGDTFSAFMLPATYNINDFVEYCRVSKDGKSLGLIKPKGKLYRYGPLSKGAYTFHLSAKWVNTYPGHYYTTKRHYELIVR
jgi:hypothetical protein